MDLGNHQEATHLDYVPNKIRQNLVLLDLLAVLTNLFFHDVLLVLQPRRLGTDDLHSVGRRRSPRKQCRVAHLHIVFNQTCPLYDIFRAQLENVLRNIGPCLLLGQIRGGVHCSIASCGDRCGGRLGILVVIITATVRRWLAGRLSR
jgi:hypothetical protein